MWVPQPLLCLHGPGAGFVVPFQGQQLLPTTSQWSGLGQRELPAVPITNIIGSVNRSNSLDAADKVLRFPHISAILTLPIRCTGLKTIRQRLDEALKEHHARSHSGTVSGAPFHCGESPSHPARCPIRSSAVLHLVGTDPPAFVRSDAGGGAGSPRVENVSPTGRGSCPCDH